MCPPLSRAARLRLNSLAKICPTYLSSGSRETAVRRYAAHHWCPSQVNAILRYCLSESKLSPSFQHLFPVQLKDTHLAISDHRCRSIQRPSLRLRNIEELKRTGRELVMFRAGSSGGVLDFKGWWKKISLSDERIGVGHFEHRGLIRQTLFFCLGG